MSLDFLFISMNAVKKGVYEVAPDFNMVKSKDLMIRGGDFYAIWVEESGIWSTDEFDAIRLIDNELREYVKENCSGIGNVHVKWMFKSSSGMIDRWHKYCKNQLRDNFHNLDETLTFARPDGRTNKEDYASKFLPYSLTPCPIPNYERLISTLYSEEERRKIEWAIGAVVSGDSKRIQKFLVFYGSAGTGKSTIMNIIQQLFEGYYAPFDAKSLGSSNAQFALEPFKDNPLVGIQHDGDLSRIEDNTRLNSLVSHEEMTVNTKNKSLYSTRFNSFLFMGTNKPVKITDAKSGLIRRLIDVSPSGNKLGQHEYEVTTENIKFELGGIAHHCLEVYKSDPNYYNSYIPARMMSASNNFYNFVEDSYFAFIREDYITLKTAWAMYKNYCSEANVSYPGSMMVFKEELKNYFTDFKDRHRFADGSFGRNIYFGFKKDQFSPAEEDDEEIDVYSIDFKDQLSVFDEVCRDLPAQYASKAGTPLKKWEEVKTKLSDIDTSKLHYVLMPENHIVIDFDIPDENGEKDFAKNLEAANKFPKTYAEVSKSGKGIHLHYFYTGDPSKLNRLYAPHIEVKVYSGNGSLRRMLTKCNDLPIATISSGLPLKGEKMVNKGTIKSEKGIRRMVAKNLRKEIHPNTKPSIDFIEKILDDAYASGIRYDITDMRNSVLGFAASSTNNGNYCVEAVLRMKFKSKDSDEPLPVNEGDFGELIFFDIEVFPNLFLVCWKKAGDPQVMRMFNPKPSDIERLLNFKLVGFNNRKYDNHMLYGCMLGYSNEELYHLSVDLVSKKKRATFGEAYNLSYTDVLDFASAGNKKSLKKLEIEMGIHHQELGLPWDKPVDESLWDKVAEYCENDVIATEAAFYYLKGDWTARQILSDLSDMSKNDSTNSLTQKIVCGNNRAPQTEFLYRDMSQPVKHLDIEVMKFLKMACPEMMASDFVVDGVRSLIPFFPGYSFEGGKSYYRGELVGEGGFVYAEHGIHTDVALLDVASMHPHSIIAECLFGPRYTSRFRELVEGRVSIKHEDWDAVETMLDGKLTPYISKVTSGEMTAKELANALKTAINAVYGLTYAGFDNRFRDIRNKDNLVAKRGSLFMVDLMNEVKKRGFTVAHIKTDSIKIPEATPEIIQFVMDFGKKYGYTFEHEATYEKMCLVNDSVYIAKYASQDWCQEQYGYLPDDNKKKAGKWTATGKQFAVPYVFKNLFSKEPVTFDDLCETKSVQTAIYLDMNESLPDVKTEEKEYKKLTKMVRDAEKESDEAYEKVYAECKDDMDRLESVIATGHEYHFVGRVGLFCPIKPGAGGGILLREDKGNYNAVEGTTGYRWLESEMVVNLDKKDDIDMEYYDNLVNKAVEAISKHGDFEWFSE